MACQTASSEDEIRQSQAQETPKRVQVLAAATFDGMTGVCSARIRPFLLAVVHNEHVCLKGEDSRLAGSDLLRVSLAFAVPPGNVWRSLGCPGVLPEAITHWLALQGAPHPPHHEPAFNWVLGAGLESHFGEDALRTVLLRPVPAAVGALLQQFAHGAIEEPERSETPAFREELLQAMPMLEESWLKPYAHHVLQASTPAHLELCRSALAQRLPHVGRRFEPDTVYRLAQLELLEMLCATTDLPAGTLLEDTLLQWLALRQAAELQRGPIEAASVATLRLLPTALRVIQSWLQSDISHLDYGYSSLSGEAALHATSDNLVQLGLLAEDLRQQGHAEALPPGFHLALSEALLTVEHRLGRQGSVAALDWLAEQNEVDHA